MRFWDEMQEPANLQENHKVMLGNPDLVGEDAYQSTSLNRLRGLFGGVEQITTQAELDAWRPESGFAIVTMGVNIDQNIKDIFGLDNNKIEMHSYTIGGTGASAGDTYQQGVSAIDGKTYRRSYNALTGWTDFTVLVDREVFRNRGLFSVFGYGLVSVNDVFYDNGGIAYVCIQEVTYSLGGDNPPLTDTNYYKELTFITRKIDFIDWESDLDENYSVIKGQIIRMNGTGGDATSEYWYIVLQDYTGTKTDVNPLNSRTYYFDIIGSEPAISKSTGILSWTGSAWAWITTTFQDASKLVTSWTYTTLNTNYPSEKLVKDSLDLKLDKPTSTKTIPIDADSLVVKDSADSNKYKDVLKADLNEVHVGDTEPTHNEKLWVDTTSINNLSFIANTSSFIVPDFAPVIAKYTSNYASGNTVLVEFPINPPKTNDPLQYLVIKNLKGSDVTFVVNTGDDVVGSITYTYELMQTDSIVVPSGKRVELSYMYMMTSATTCLVSIMYKVQE